MARIAESRQGCNAHAGPAKEHHTPLPKHGATAIPTWAARAQPVRPVIHAMATCTRCPNFGCRHRCGSLAHRGAIDGGAASPLPPLLSTTGPVWGIFHPAGGGGYETKAPRHRSPRFDWMNTASPRAGCRMEHPHWHGSRSPSASCNVWS